MSALSSSELAALSTALQVEADRRACRSFHEFVRRAWHIVEGANPFRDNWHIRLICAHMEAVRERRLVNGIINVPPGSMKSLLVSVMFNAWVWTLDPSARFLTASYGQDLSTRDALKTRQILDSDWYQARWGHLVRMERGQNQKTKFQNTAGGWRLATSVGGRGTGEHPDYKLVDDPHNVTQAMSDVERLAANTWFDMTLSTRGESRDPVTLIVMQRLHEQDLTGHVLSKPRPELEDLSPEERSRQEYFHLCLPMRYEPGRYRSPLGEDPRRTKGELLWPELFTERKVRKLEVTLGSFGTSGQLQQRPSPEGGGIFQRKHFRLWPAGLPLPSPLFVVQTYDTACTDDTANDPTAMQAWAVVRHPTSGRNVALLLDAWQEHLLYPKLRQRAQREFRESLYGGNEEQHREPRRADVVLIENKSSGISLQQDLQVGRVPVVPYNPGKADKTQRAMLSLPIVETGAFYVPESTRTAGVPRDWVEPVLHALELFPNSDDDHHVDAFTQMARYLKDSEWLVLDVFDDPPEPVDYSAKRRNPYGG